MNHITKPLFLLLSAATILHAAEKPNILIIYADDLGYGDVSCYNPDRGKIPTPHIDKLAAQGMRFTDGHSSSAVCSPSRYTLLTGRCHWRSRLQSGIVGTWGDSLIAPDRLTLGGLVRQHGYRTAMAGKWHLGWNWPVPEGEKQLLLASAKKNIPATEAQKAMWNELFSQAIPGGPVDRGFDRYFGTCVPNWPPFCFIEDRRTVGIPSEFLPAKLLTNAQASVQGPALKDWTLEPILPAITDRASAWIRELAKGDDPFFLYLPLTAPHTPIAVNEEWKGKSGINPYADFVMETDAMIGRVLAALEESGAADNTLVIFTGDNGCAPPANIPELEAKGHFPSGPLRGYKFDAWEGGHRVPFIVRWPGRVKPGAVNQQLVQQADLMATFADILGATLPGNSGEDSFSLLSLLDGKDQPVRPHAVNCSASGVPALRHGPWKLILGWPGRDGKAATNPSIHLYNLADDLGETKNLASAMPEKVAEMRVLLEKLITDGRSTPGAKQTNDVEVRRFPGKNRP
jgi:arylsulfatase A-like enzyme